MERKRVFTVKPFQFSNNKKKNQKMVLKEESEMQ